jgi:hypothetical protein
LLLLLLPLQCKSFPGCLGPEVAEAAAAAAPGGRSGVVFSVGMALEVGQRDRLVGLLREQVGENDAKTVMPSGHGFLL